LGPTQSLVRWVLGHFRRLSGQGMALATHLHLSPKLKKEWNYPKLKSGAIPPLPHCAFVTGCRVNFSFFNFLPFSKHSTNFFHENAAYSSLVSCDLNVNK